MVHDYYITITHGFPFFGVGTTFQSWDGWLDGWMECMECMGYPAVYDGPNYYRYEAERTYFVVFGRVIPWLLGSKLYIYKPNTCGLEELDGVSLSVSTYIV